MKTRKPKRPVYHVGDIIEVVEPIVTRRVGYPLSLADGYDHLAKELVAEVKAMNAALYRVVRKARGEPEEGVKGFETDTFILDENGAAVRDDPVIWALARRYLPMVGYGGQQRSLHTEVVEALRGQSVRVVSKRCVRTGTHYPSHCSQDYWGDYDYEPGGLSNGATHVLLEVEPVGDVLAWRDTIGPAGQFTVEIEAIHVRAVLAAPDPWEATISAIRS